MVSIVYQEHDGTRHELQVAVGTTLMEAALRNGVPSIEGECGGACACATCHIYVPDTWRALTGAASDFELSMLECSDDVDERSRLGCQIQVTEQMDGMVVLTPRVQR